MPIFGPISRRDLIAALRVAGFSGPYSGGKHQFIYMNHIVTIKTL
ncbi:MAG: hypothetical protein WBA93_32575 [Microcoleaceae cyanobacterium]